MRHAAAAATDQQAAEKTLFEVRLKRTHVGAPLEQLASGVLERLPRYAQLLQSDNHAHAQYSFVSVFSFFVFFFY